MYALDRSEAEAAGGIQGAFSVTVPQSRVRPEPKQPMDAGRVALAARQMERGHPVPALVVEVAPQ